MSPFKSALIALVALAGFSGAAHASDVPDGYEQRTVRISVADLDLYSEVGVKAFLKRVDKGAERACGGRPQWQPMTHHDATRAYRKCHSDAMEAAVEQSDSALVAVRYAEKTGRTTMLASN